MPAGSLSVGVVGRGPESGQVTMRTTGPQSKTDLTGADRATYRQRRSRASATSPGSLAGNPPTRRGAPGEDQVGRR